MGARLLRNHHFCSGDPENPALHRPEESLPTNSAQQSTRIHKTGPNKTRHTRPYVNRARLKRQV
jgi:hypothetical protein